MSAVTILQMAERVSAMMEERLGISGKGLTAKLKRGKGRLPRKVAAAAQALDEAAERAKNPKLFVQIDQGAVADAYDICVRHLAKQKPGNRLVGLLVRVGATLALGLLILGSVVLVVLRMRGQI